MFIEAPSHWPDTILGALPTSLPILTENSQGLSFIISIYSSGHWGSERLCGHREPAIRDCLFPSGIDNWQGPNCFLGAAYKKILLAGRAYSSHSLEGKILCTVECDFTLMTCLAMCRFPNLSVRRGLWSDVSQKPDRYKNLESWHTQQMGSYLDLHRHMRDIDYHPMAFGVSGSLQTFTYSLVPWALIENHSVSGGVLVL